MSLQLDGAGCAALRARPSSLVDPRRRSRSLAKCCGRGVHDRQLLVCLHQFSGKHCDALAQWAGVRLDLLGNPSELGYLWRRNLGAKFKFNPSDPADAQERGRVERELQLEYTKEQPMLD